jgi:hypothetical protein
MALAMTKNNVMRVKWNERASIQAQLAVTTTILTRQIAFT